jgi:Rad3-related DNA helicase
MTTTDQQPFEATKHFPYSEFRKHQLSTIDKIYSTFHSGKPICILDAPTGAGKSVIAITLANYYEYAYIITPQKMLQDQYMKDFGDKIVDLKGRNAYTCERNGMSCDMGECKQEGKSKGRDCVGETSSDTSCEYYRRVYEAMESPITLFNFKSFIYQLRQQRFKRRTLLVIDEGHNIESELVSVLTLRLTDKQLAQLDIPWAPITTVADLIGHLHSNGILGKIKATIADLKDQGKYVDMMNWQNMLDDVGYFLRTANDDSHILSVGTIQSRKQGDIRYVDIKPLYIRDQLAILTNQGIHTLIMSATILSSSILADSLGLESSKFSTINVPSVFPKRNRPIVVKPAGSMTYANIDKTMPVLIEYITKVLNHHEGQKGIIHTHSFKILNAIKKGLNGNAELRRRLLFQNDFWKREEMIAKHMIGQDTVIVAPAMHEGLDLKEDLSRFQVICKIPYPSTADPWIAKRQKAKNGWQFYNWLTALKLVQSYGRSIRSETDTAVTYILDSHIDKFLKQAKYILPIWFKEAVIRK